MINHYSEIDVGITEFISQYNGQIKSVFKYKISDFIVNEVTLDKKVLFLNKNNWTIKKNEILEEQKIDSSQGKEQTNLLIKPDKLSQLIDLIGQNNVDKLQKFYDNLNNGDKCNEFHIIVQCPDDKIQRRDMHNIIRESLPQFDSTTEESDIEQGKKQIKIFYIKNQMKKIKQQYFHIVAILMKIGLDTISASFNISKYLRISTKSISYAGIKDKRGITTQQICFYTNLEKNDLEKRLLNGKWKDQIKLSDFSVQQNQIRTGDLYGNRFSIALRLIEEININEIKSIFEQIQQYGFINYYGLQRFGTGQIRTHQVGKELVMRNWKKAFELILSQKNPMDDNYNTILTEFLLNRDASKALKGLNNKYKIEKLLLEGYKKYGDGNYLNALGNITRNARELYGHSYQSFLWNKLASFRIKQYGRQVVIGDIVAKSDFYENELGEEMIEQDNQQQEEKEQQELNDNDNQNENIQDELSKDEKQHQQYQGINDFKINIVDKSNISQYTIKDVLIPIIGGKLALPNDYLLKNYLNQLLQEEGIQLEHFQKLNKQFFVEGGYRRLICDAEDLEYKILQFNDKGRDILTPYYNLEQDFSEESGKYSAIAIKFTLKKGSYATMMIREITRCSTAFSELIKNNKLYEDLK